MKGDWQRVKLGEIAQVVGGATPSTKCEANYGGDIPWISPKDLSGYGYRYISRGERNITQLGFDSSSTVMLPKNTILFSSRAPIGYVALAENELCTNQGFKSLIPDPTKLDSLFGFYCLKANVDSIESRAVGSTFKEVSASIMRDIEISLPPLPTQRRIAAVLGALDDKIELNRKLNANLEAQAQALFKSWFVDFEPWGGKMPTGWKVGKAEDFFDISIGKTPPRKIQDLFSTVKAQNETWVSIADMGNVGVFIENSSEYLIPSAVKDYNVSVAPKDSVLLSFKLTVGRVCIASQDLTTNEAIAQFKPSEAVPKEYIYLYLKNFNYEKLGSTSSIATAVNSKMIKAMNFVLPAADVLARFSIKIRPLFDCILINQQESRKLSELRDTLLPKLMSGELEVAG